MKFQHSPHILLYKPQINSAISLFFRLLIIISFFELITELLNFNFNLIGFFYLFTDPIFFSELLLLFFLLFEIFEDVLDQNQTILNSKLFDFDLVFLFRFFSEFLSYSSLFFS